MPGQNHINFEIMFDISSPRAVTCRDRVHTDETAPYFEWDQVSDAVEAYTVFKIHNYHPQNQLPEYLLDGATCCQFDAF